MLIRPRWSRKANAEPPHGPKASGSTKLGPQSPLVLAKLGHDMRQDYEALIAQPLPDEIQKVAQQLPERPMLRTVEGPGQDEGG